MLSGAGIAYPRTHNLVMLSELLRPIASPLPPDAEAFGPLVPFGVVLRYEDMVADEPPARDPAEFEAMVTRTIEWAHERLNREPAQADLL